MLILLKLVCGIMPAHIKTLLQPSKSSASHLAQALRNIAVEKFNTHYSISTDNL